MNNLVHEVQIGGRQPALLAAFRGLVMRTRHHLAGHATHNVLKWCPGADGCTFSWIKGLWGRSRSSDSFTRLVWGEWRAVPGRGLASRYCTPRIVVRQLQVSALYDAESMSDQVSSGG